MNDNTRRAAARKGSPAYGRTGGRNNFPARLWTLYSWMCSSALVACKMGCGVVICTRPSSQAVEA